jgi:phage repressor protein C with HTH and peptisase S24 domain
VYAINFRLSQLETSDNRDCDNRKGVANGLMTQTVKLTPVAAEIFRRLDALGLTQRALADELNLAENKISKARIGERQFKAAEAELARAWLTEQERRRRPAANTSMSAAADQDMVDILSLDLRFSMGPGSTIDDYIEEEPVRFSIDFVRTFTRTPPARLRRALGVGDSMYPTLLNSDAVWIDTTQKMLNLNDRIWAISLFGAAAIKRLRPIGKGRILVISDNPDIPNPEVDEADLIIGGRVIRLERDV